MKYLKKQHGFTLLEMIIVIVISGIIIVGSSSLLLQGFKTYMQSRESTFNVWKVQIAIEQITNDLHEVSYIKKISPSSLNIHTVSGEDIIYKVEDKYLKRNNDILTDTIKNVIFKYYDTNGRETSIVYGIAYIKVYIESTSVSLSATTFLWTLW